MDFHENNGPRHHNRQAKVPIKGRVHPIKGQMHRLSIPVGTTTKGTTTVKKSVIRHWTITKSKFKGYGRNRVMKLLGLFPATEMWVKSKGVFGYLEGYLS